MGTTTTSSAAAGLRSLSPAGGLTRAEQLFSHDPDLLDAIASEYSRLGPAAVTRYLNTLLKDSGETISEDAVRNYVKKRTA